MNRQEIADRFVTLRGTRTQREIAVLVGVTPQAVAHWERVGRVGVEKAAAYDAALGAGGEVLSLLGFTPLDGPTLGDVAAKLDELLGLVHGMGATLELIAGVEPRPEPLRPPAPAPAKRVSRRRADPTGPVRRP